ncbi:hypothetical protein ACMXYV_00950 [Neptuniibacter sp. SY11_33]
MASADNWPTIPCTGSSASVHCFSRSAIP